MTDPAVRRTSIKSQNTIRKLVTLQLRNVAVVEAAPVAGDTAAVDNNQESGFLLFRVLFSFWKTIEIFNGKYLSLV